jgi:regulator of extracellular matrix RemA (YlzA/DUF370 family)
MIQLAIGLGLVSGELFVTPAIVSVKWRQSDKATRAAVRLPRAGYGSRTRRVIVTVSVCVVDGGASASKDHFEASA